MAFLRDPDLQLLAEWAVAHASAQKAEKALPCTGGAPAGAGAVDSARDLRAVADVIFSELLVRDAFGPLKRMP